MRRTVAPPGRRGDEVPPQLAHQERRVGRMAQAEVDQLVRPEAAAMAEHRLDAAVVAVGFERYRRRSPVESSR